MKVSIIIPVYNAERTLRRCLDSILKQTYKDYEIIIINDGSTDQSWAIMQNYAGKFPEAIRIWNQENMGAAAARNNGIDMSGGEYIIFIDNDDYIPADYVQCFVQKAESTQSDMVVGNYCRIRENGKVIYTRKAHASEWVIFQLQAPWARIYRKSFLVDHKIRFLASPIGEDVYFNIVAACVCQSWACASTNYYWVDNSQSVSNTKQKGMKTFCSPLYMLDCLYNRIKNEKISPEKQDYCEYFFIRYLVWHILFSGKQSDWQTAYSVYTDEIRFLSDRYPGFQKNKNISLFKPKGETWFNRITVLVFMLLHRFHGIKLLLKIYCKEKM
ncbi:MAG: glycosyltransferase family 2 protein [Clostridiaceae bacterium]|nr:glycosyltransferase family 2 protein [Clostridiaceae bacterium]